MLCVRTLELCRFDDRFSVWEARGTDISSISVSAARAEAAGVCTGELRLQRWAQQPEARFRLTLLEKRARVLLQLDSVPASLHTQVGLY